MSAKFILLLRFPLAIKFLNLAYQPVRACSIYSDLWGFHRMERNDWCTGGIARFAHILYVKGRNGKAVPVIN
jgi:hypothetical protein